MSKTRLVYSTDKGRIQDAPETKQPPKGDGVVRLRLETKGRKGKGVTTISGLDLAEAELKQLSKELKQVCGSGGSVKDFTIEIQGDHRQRLREHLEKLGHTTKLAGG